MELPEICRQQFIRRVDLRKIELHQPVIGYNLMFPLLHSRSLSFLLSPCFSHARTSLSPIIPSEGKNINIDPYFCQNSIYNKRNYLLIIRT